MGTFSIVGFYHDATGASVQMRLSIPTSPKSGEEILPPIHPGRRIAQDAQTLEAAGGLHRVFHLDVVMHKPRLSDTFTIRSSSHGCSRARPHGLMRSESLLRLRTSTPCQVHGCGRRLPAWTGSPDSFPVCIETTRYNTPQSRGQYWCEGRGQHATSSHYIPIVYFNLRHECLLVYTLMFTDVSIYIPGLRRYRTWLLHLDPMEC